MLIECAGLIGDGYLPSRAAPCSSMGLLKKAALTHSRPRPRGAPLPIGNPPPESQVAPVRVWSALMFGFVRFSAVATAPGFVLFPNWGNWRAVEFATGFATPVPRNTGCAMQFAKR